MPSASAPAAPALQPQAAEGPYLQALLKPSRVLRRNFPFRRVAFSEFLLQAWPWGEERRAYESHSPSEGQPGPGCRRPLPPSLPPAVPMCLTFQGIMGIYIIASLSGSFENSTGDMFNPMTLRTSRRALGLSYTEGCHRQVDDSLSCCDMQCHCPITQDNPHASRSEKCNPEKHNTHTETIFPVG